MRTGNEAPTAQGGGWGVWGVGGAMHYEHRLDKKRGDLDEDSPSLPPDAFIQKLCAVYPECTDISSPQPLWRCHASAALDETQ